MKAKKTIIETARLVMRSIRFCDWKAASVLLTDPNIKQTYLLPDFANQEEVTALFEKIRKRSEDPASFVYGIFLADELIGWINEVTVQKGCIEVGYVISPKHQNQGYATECLQAAIPELFRMGYCKVRAGYFEENVASGRVMAKSGMHLVEDTEELTYRGQVRRCRYYEIEAS